MMAQVLLLADLLQVDLVTLCQNRELVQSLLVYQVLKHCTYDKVVPVVPVSVSLTSIDSMNSTKKTSPQNDVMRRAMSYGANKKPWR